MPGLNSEHLYVQLETQLAAPYDLPAFLHCKLWSTPSHLCHNLLSRDTMIAWREVRRKLNLSPCVSQHLPIHENPSFSSTTSHSGLKIWAHQKLKHFTQLFDLHTGNAKPVSHTLVYYELPQHHFLLIHQAIQHVSSLCRTNFNAFRTLFWILYWNANNSKSLTSTNL